MGILIDVRDHNLGIERQRVELLTNLVDADINKISNCLNDLGNYWQDEKSGPTISELTSMLDEVKTANNKAKTDTKQYLEDIGRILKMNYGS